jgi:hypothetical protein
MTRSVDGFTICAVRGCDEPARPWSYAIDVGDLEVEVVLCPRHDREMLDGLDARGDVRALGKAEATSS